MHARKPRYYIVFFVSEILLLIACSSVVSAQNDPPTIPASTFGIHLVREVQTGITALIFGSVVMLIQAISLKQAKASQETIMISFIITLIVVSSLFVVSLGWSNQQIAPIMSLYSGILGYLLGKRDSSNSSKQSKEEERDHV